MQLRIPLSRQGWSDLTSIPTIWRTQIAIGTRSAGTVSWLSNCRTHMRKNGNLSGTLSPTNRLLVYLIVMLKAHSSILPKLYCKLGGVPLVLIVFYGMIRLRHQVSSRTLNNFPFILRCAWEGLCKKYTLHTSATRIMPYTTSVIRLF